jgi:hypothetical protein
MLGSSYFKAPPHVAWLASGWWQTAIKPARKPSAGQAGKLAAQVRGIAYAGVAVCGLVRVCKEDSL